MNSANKTVHRENIVKSTATYGAEILDFNKNLETKRMSVERIFQLQFA